MLGLAQRIEELDSEPDTGDPREDITHFISVLERVVSFGTPDNLSDVPHMSARVADKIVQQSCLLGRLTKTVPEIVIGPLRKDRQYWVGTSRSKHLPQGLPKGETALGKAQFVEVSRATCVEISTKPFRVGLFTSTGVLDNYGMWRLYLQMNKGSTLHPLPWQTWTVKPRHDLVVYELASAAQWVDLVLAHPLRKKGLLFPDWASVASKYDAVHVTLRAIAAMQGVYFLTKQGIIDAPYWDVESTFWLRWCFSSARLVETVT